LVYQRNQIVTEIVQKGLKGRKIRKGRKAKNAYISMKCR